MLYATIFLTGAIIMIVELVGIRLFVPYFGSTMDIVTGIISTVLTALGVGYYIGGRMADNKPSYTTLITVLILASFILIGSFTWSHHVLTALSQFHSLRIMVVIASSVILMGPTSLLLAMVSPYVLRLQLSSIKATGSIAGKTYALGTIGSIVGTLFAGYILIPRVPLDEIILYTGIGLFVWAIALAVYMKQSFKLLAVFVLIIMILGFLYINIHNGKKSNALYSVESKYSNIQVKDGYITEEGSKLYGRYIYVNNRCCQSGMNVDRPEELYFKNLQYFAKIVSSIPAPKSFLVIGGGGYTFPNHILINYPKAHVDVVEIDPEMTRIAHTYFAVPHTTRLKTIEDDGRIFLNRNVKQYDVIAIDVFHEYSIPFSLFTQEAISKLNQSLKENGVVLVNILSAVSGPNSALFASTYKTYTSVFATVNAYKVYSTPKDKIQNIIFVATQSTNKQFTNNTLPESSRIAPEKDIVALLLRDNFAPVETMLLP